MNKTILLLAVFAAMSRLGSQPQVPFGPVFPQTEVTEVRILLEQDSLDQMLLEENWYSNHEYPATFIFHASGLQDTVFNVGFRLRGNSSREAFKKSFKVSFNTFSQGGEWMGLEKLNLNGEHNDPSMMRSKLCWDMLRAAGLPAARTAYCRLYVNDEYKGLYINVEHVDETFVDRVFDEPDADGNLYKCLYPATLQYQGPDGDDYKTEFFGRRIYALKTNEWADNYGDLAAFVDALNNEPDETLPCALKEVFHIDHYLRFAAMEVLTGHWDGYIFNKNNFYLYHNTRSGQLEFLAYDMDNTLGIDWMGGDWTTRNIYNYSPPGNERPLYERLMANETLRAQYSAEMQNLITNVFNADIISEICTYWQSLIAEAVYEDVYRTMDYGFTNEDFDNAPWSAFGGHVEFGIVEYAEARVAEALDQLEAASMPVVVAHWVAGDHPVVSPAPVIARASITGNDASACTMSFSTDQVNWLPAVSASNGDTPWDDVADDIYSWWFDVPAAAQKVYFRILHNGTPVGCADNWLWSSESALPLWINETAASDPMVIDETGEAEDWVELYSTASAPINLTGEFLTDDLRNPDKFPLPAETINAGTYKLVWCDNDPEQAPLHATFGLGGNDSLVYLLTRSEGKERIIDMLPFTNLEGWSTEREPDGSTFIQLTNTPTPGSSNLGLHANEAETETPFAVYPNPTRGQVCLPDTVATYQLFDARGRAIAVRSEGKWLDLSPLEAGVYLLVTANGSALIFRE